MAKMETRQWMVTHEWMTKPMPQKEWIERRGIMVWIAEVFTSLGSGLFLVSLFMNSWWGMVFGWIIIMFLKLPVHLAYFGKPFRFYQTIPPFSNAWKTSWFARGILFTILFSSFSFVQLVVGHPFIAHLIGPVWLPIYFVFAVLAGIFALGTGVYGGFIMNFVKGIPFWNQGLLPVVFILAGVADGFGLIMGIGMGGLTMGVGTIAGNSSIEVAEMGSRFLLLVNIFIIIVYLISASYTSAIAKLSIKELLTGKAAFAFWFGLIILGIIIPLAISLASFATGGAASSILLVIAIICHTLGAFALKYCLLKVGYYRPLLPKVAAY
jgi:formate-dependent nitrite reductase membrane component NrfD